MKIKIRETPVIRHIYNTIRDSVESRYIIKSLPNTEKGIYNFEVITTPVVYDILCKAKKLMTTDDTMSQIKLIEYELKSFMKLVRPLYTEGVESLEYEDDKAMSYVITMNKITLWYEDGLFGDVKLKYGGGL